MQHLFRNAVWLLCFSWCPDLSKFCLKFHLNVYCSLVHHGLFYCGWVYPSEQRLVSMQHLFQNVVWLLCFSWCPDLSKFCLKFHLNVYYSLVHHGLSYSDWVYPPEQRLVSMQYLFRNALAGQKLCLLTRPTAKPFPRRIFLLTWFWLISTPEKFFSLLNLKRDDNWLCYTCHTK